MAAIDGATVTGSDGKPLDEKLLTDAGLPKVDFEDPSFTVMITGGCGFIGHHFVEHVYRLTKWKIIVIDKLTYASSGLDRLRDCFSDIKDWGFPPPRLRVYAWDLAQPMSVGLIKELGEVDYIVHMAAETHVDNSIEEPVYFVQNNTMSTVHLLEYARNLMKKRPGKLKVFFYFSTDEVFGPALGDTLYKEWDRHKPTNPYSASKSAAEQICIAYENTYKIPLMIVNVMN